jgi:hypothetical protein
MSVCYGWVEEDYELAMTAPYLVRLEAGAPFTSLVLVRGHLVRGQVLKHGTHLVRGQVSHLVRGQVLKYQFFLLHPVARLELADKRQ